MAVQAQTTPQMEASSPATKAPRPALTELAPETGGLDSATILGLIGSIAMIYLAIALGGAERSFLQLPAFLIVILGTCFVTAISFSFEELGDGLTALTSSLWNKKRNPRKVLRQLLQFSDYCHKSSALSLLQAIEKKAIDPFLKHSITLLADGLPPKEIHRLLEEETDTEKQRKQRASAVLKKAAEVAPAMGLIGTLVGLIQMLSSLDDPEAIGPAMAVALLTTFYGAFMGSVVLSPLAAKIDRNMEEVCQIRDLYIDAINSMAKRENPRKLETVLNSKLRPSKRLKYFK